LEPFLGGFLGVFSGPCSWGIVGGNLCEPFVVKGLDFGDFGVLGLEEFLAGFLRFLLIWQVLVVKIMAMDSSWVILLSPNSCSSLWSDSED
jgi:hypothetical protein